MDLKEQHLLGTTVNDHWYYVSKARALAQLLHGVRVTELLDIGAGSGIFSRRLIDARICDSAVCVDPHYPGDHIEDYSGHKLRFLRSVENVPQKLILMMDVIEHVDDDIGLIRTYTELMPRDGLVMISVPAFQFLWSGHDVFLEHRRRYTRRGLERTVQAAGLEVLRSRYFFGLLMPIAAIQRWNERLWNRATHTRPASVLRSHKSFMNKALIYIHDIERAFVLPWNRLFGLTIFCLARPKNPP